MSGSPIKRRPHPPTVRLLPEDCLGVILSYVGDVLPVRLVSRHWNDLILHRLSPFVTDESKTLKTIQMIHAYQFLAGLEKPDRDNFAHNVEGRFTDGAKMQKKIDQLYLADPEHPESLIPTLRVWKGVHKVSTFDADKRGGEERHLQIELYFGAAGEFSVHWVIQADSVVEVGRRVEVMSTSWCFQFFDCANLPEKTPNTRLIFSDGWVGSRRRRRFPRYSTFSSSLRIDDLVSLSKKLKSSEERVVELLSGVWLQFMSIYAYGEEEQKLESMLQASQWADDHQEEYRSPFLT